MLIGQFGHFQKVFEFSCGTKECQLTPNEAGYCLTAIRDSLSRNSGADAGRHEYGCAKIRKLGVGIAIYLSCKFENKIILVMNYFPKRPFSFTGRIGRTEYITGIILCVFSNLIFFFILDELKVDNTPPVINVIYVLLILFPSIWVYLAQAVQRSHDLGNSGWFLFIPFYRTIMIFMPGQKGENKYGEDPRKEENSDNDAEEPEEDWYQEAINAPTEDK